MSTEVTTYQKKVLVACNLLPSHIPVCWYNLRLHFQMFLKQMQSRNLDAKQRDLGQDTYLPSLDTFFVSSHLVHTTSSITEERIFKQVGYATGPKGNNATSTSDLAKEEKLIHRILKAVCNTHWRTTQRQIHYSPLYDTHTFDPTCLQGSLHTWNRLPIHSNYFRNQWNRVKNAFNFQVKPLDILKSLLLADSPVPSWQNKGVFLF